VREIGGQSAGRITTTATDPWPMAVRLYFKEDGFRERGDRFWRGERVCEVVLVKQSNLGQGLDDPRGLGSLLFITGQTGLQEYYRWSPLQTYTES
jgi:hypothetical protein